MWPHAQGACRRHQQKPPSSDAVAAAPAHLLPCELALLLLLIGTRPLPHWAVQDAGAWHVHRRVQAASEAGGAGQFRVGRGRHRGTVVGGAGGGAERRWVAGVRWLGPRMQPHLPVGIAAWRGVAACALPADHTGMLSNCQLQLTRAAPWVWQRVNGHN